jgi:hypothetical protein
MNERVGQSLAIFSYEQHLAFFKPDWFSMTGEDARNLIHCYVKDQFNINTAMSPPT